MKHLDKDEILAKLGLETKTTTGEWLLGTLGTFGVGMLVGAGIALLLAPKAGRELRGDLRKRFSQEQDDDYGSEIQSGRSNPTVPGVRV